MFVDCIVPLPLEGVFTYNVPAHLSQKVQVGCRVNVPFGQKKQYAALVTRVHEEQPACQTKVSSSMAAKTATAKKPTTAKGAT